MQERKDKWSVGQWMTQTPYTVSPNISVREAFFQLRSRGIRHLLVTQNQKLVGIVSDRDLRRPDITDDPEGWDDFYRLDDDYEVADIMETDVVTLNPGDSLEKALDILLNRKFSALPVVDKNGQPIGILTSHDIFRAFATALDFLGKKLRESHWDWENTPYSNDS